MKMKTNKPRMRLTIKNDFHDFNHLMRLKMIANMKINRMRSLITKDEVDHQKWATSQQETCATSVNTWFTEIAVNLRQIGGEGILLRPEMEGSARNAGGWFQVASGNLTY